MIDKPVRAQQSLFLAGERDEQNAALRHMQAARLDAVGSLNQQRDIRRIVKGTVVKVIATDRRAEAIAVEVCGNDQIFAPELRVRAAEFGNDIGRTDVALSNMQQRAQRAGNFEVRQRLLGTDRFAW